MIFVMLSALMKSGDNITATPYVFLHITALAKTFIKNRRPNSILNPNVEIPDLSKQSYILLNSIYKQFHTTFSIFISLFEIY